MGETSSTVIVQLRPMSGKSVWNVDQKTVASLSPLQLARLQTSTRTADVSEHSILDSVLELHCVSCRQYA